MPRASRSFVVVFAVGVVLLLAVGLLERRSEAFTLGVTPVTPLTLARGSEVCQRSIEPPTDFASVRLDIGSPMRSVPVLDVRVLSDGRQVARDPSPSTLGGPRTLEVPLGEVQARGPISVCVRNVGRHRVEVYGNSEQASPGSTAYLDGKAIAYDVSLVFLRSGEVSLISLTGDIASRASLFRGAWIGAWSVWLIATALLTAFPLLLYRALRGVER
jgi:hypothetical protein